MCLSIIGVNYSKYMMFTINNELIQLKSVDLEV